MEEYQKHGKSGLAALRSGMHRNTASKYLKSGELPSNLSNYSANPSTRQSRLDEFGPSSA
jgi:hypothetical protein